MGLAVDEYSTDEDDDDDSLPSSPIVLSKIIKPQSHQKDFHDDKKFYLKQRRNRRGRPKREEYVYVCEEKCGHCFGGWGEILEITSGAKREDDAGDEEEKTLVPIDVEFLHNEEKKLVRCKDCREAYHPGCMRANGPAKNEEGGISMAGVDSELEASATEQVVEVQRDKNVQISSTSTNSNIQVTIAGPSIKDESDQVPLNNATENANSSEISNSNETVSIIKETDGVSGDLVETSDETASGESQAKTTTDDNNRSDSQNSRASDKSDASVQVELPRRPPRIPKRCSKCEVMRKLDMTQDVDGNENKEDNRDIVLPSKKQCSFKLEAVVDGKSLLCSVDPEPSIEADVDGKKIACRVVFDDDSINSSKRDSRGDAKIEDPSKEKPDSAVRVAKRQKRKNPTLVTETKDPTAKKVEKIASKASDHIAKVTCQEKYLDEVQQLVDGPVTTESVVKAGGMEIIAGAMTNHPKVSSIQAKSISTMTEIVWYSQSLGIDLVNHACLDLTIAAMENHGVLAEVQLLGCELFRALSYDSECCNAMLEADVITFVAASMKRNANEVEVLKEAR